MGGFKLLMSLSTTEVLHIFVNITAILFFVIVVSCQCSWRMSLFYDVQTVCVSTSTWFTNVTSTNTTVLNDNLVGNDDERHFSFVTVAAAEKTCF